MRLTKENICYAHSDVCGGGSPWKSNNEVTRATIRLSNRGVDIAGLSEQEVLERYQTTLRKDLAPEIEGESKP